MKTTKKLREEEMNMINGGLECPKNSIICPKCNGDCFIKSSGEMECFFYRCTTCPTCDGLGYLRLPETD